MRISREAVTAGALFFALTTPFGIAAHLVSELAGLGWPADARLALSPRHAYLALLALLALGGFWAALRSVPRGERRACVARLIAYLPWRGEGLGFAVASFSAQFAFFGLSELGEGNPLGAGDVLLGIVAAAGAAALGAIFIALGKRRVFDLALALTQRVRAVSSPAAAAQWSARRDPGTPLRLRRRSPFAFRYRPPPRDAVTVL